MDVPDGTSKSQNPNFQKPTSQRTNLALWDFGVLALGILALCACVPSTRPSIKIGVVAPFEGRYRQIGEEIIYAVRLAVREANESGGIKGYTIELMAFDDGGDPAQAEEQARKLATDPQVVGAIGNWLDSTTLAAALVLADSGIPFLATTSSPDLDPSAFRLWLTDTAYLAAAPDSQHCPLPCDSLENLDWFANPQLPITNYQRSGPPLWGLTQFPRLAGDAAESVHVITPSPLPAESSDPSFADRYRAISPGVEPRFLAVLAYDATRILFDAISRDIQSNRMPTRSGVETALAQTDYNALSGHFSFNADRDWYEVSGWVYQWREGQLIKP